MSLLTFPIFFTRSLSFETALAGCKRSFTSGQLLQSKHATAPTHQHSRILLPRQGFHDDRDGMYRRSQRKERPAHNICNCNSYIRISMLLMCSRGVRRRPLADLNLQDSEERPEPCPAFQQCTSKSPRELDHAP